MRGLAVAPDGQSFVVACGDGHAGDVATMADLSANLYYPVLTRVRVAGTVGALAAGLTRAFVLHGSGLRMLVSMLQHGRTEPIATLDVGDGKPAGLLALSADEQRLYVTATEAGATVLQVLDCRAPESFAVLATVSLPHPPAGLAPDWYGDWVYLLGTATTEEVLSVLDTSTGRLVHLPLGRGPSGIASARDRLFRCHFGTGALTTIQIIS
jgi:hypothetical protein